MISHRDPRPDEAAALAELGRASFVDAFGHLYRPEDLNAFLDATYTPEVLNAELADANRVFRVAEDDGALIGYCKLGLDRSLDYDAGGVPTIELKQLYLRGNQTGGGIGGALMGWVFEQAQERGFEQVILSVWSENLGGQRFYRRHGFEKWGDTIFMVGSQRDEEFIFGRRV